MTLQNLAEKLEAAIAAEKSATHARLRVEAEICREIASSFGIEMSTSLFIGTWACAASPVKFCVYNEDADPCLDDCLYCHKPDERK